MTPEQEARVNIDWLLEQAGWSVQNADSINLCICSELDAVVDSFLGRPLDGGPYPYLWLDALTQKVREDGRIVNVSVAVATGSIAMGSGRCLASTWGRARTARSGWRSCVRWRPGAWVGWSW